MELKIHQLLKMLCRDGNCPGSLAPIIIDMALPSTFFDDIPGLNQKPTTFAELIDAMVLKYSKGQIKMGANLKLPPPLSFMWGEDLLGKHGTEQCTMTAFPMQNTMQYGYDDDTVVKQYCNLANYVWCNGKPNDCTRKGGAIFAHSTGALTLLKGLELGICRKDMKINIMDAPLKGITLMELLHRRDDVWCKRSTEEDKYFDDFFNDIKTASPVCGPKVKGFVDRFGTSIGSFLSTFRSSFKETSHAFHKKEATIALIDSMDGRHSLATRTERQQTAFLELFHALPNDIHSTKDIVLGFKSLKREHKLDAIALFRTLDAEKRITKGNNAEDDMVEKEMQRLPMHEWSTDDQDMLIELFEKQVSQQDSQHDSQHDSQQEQSFQSTSTNPQQHHTSSLLRRKLLSARQTEGKSGLKQRRRGWVFKAAYKAAKRHVVDPVKRHVVDPALAFVVPHIKSAADWIHENAIKPTGSFLKKYVIDPAANFLNNCYQFFKGLVSFNPRETIAGILRAALCGDPLVKHKIAWGTSTHGQGIKVSGIIDKAIADGIETLTTMIEEKFNDPHFAVEIEDIMEHMRSLSPSRMAQTTLAATAEKHALGMHCGASYLGLPLPMAPDVNLFEKMFSPSILADVDKLVKKHLNKNTILLAVKKKLGSCGATMMIDKAFPWMMNAIPGMAECVPKLMEPWLNEDSSDGIIETRSCGAAEHFGDNRAHSKFSSLVETSNHKWIRKATIKMPSRGVVQSKHIITKSKAKATESELESASKIIDSEDNSGGRCAPLVPGADDACTQSKDQATCESSAPLRCTWFASSVGAPTLVFPEYLTDIHDYALKEEEHLKSERQKLLEEECNVPYRPTTKDGGYDPLVLAGEGFVTKPNGRKYVSACNYANTMGVGGNAPSKGCAPHCWMGFRMLELAKMRNTLPIPESTRPKPKPVRPITAPGTNGAGVQPMNPPSAPEEQETKAKWSADPSCVSINDPFNQKAYFGFIVDVDKFSQAEEVTLGIRELTNLLSMIDLHPSIPIEARTTLKKCMPRIESAMRDWMIPKCTAECQLQKSCKSWCESLRSDCLSHASVTDLLNQVISGDSDVRQMAKSMIGDKMNVVDVLIKKLLTCGGESGITFSTNVETCRVADAALEPCVPTNGALPPAKKETETQAAAVVVTDSSDATPPAKPDAPRMVVDPNCVTITDPLDETRKYTGSFAFQSKLSETKPTQEDYFNGVHSLKSLLSLVGDLVGQECVQKIVQTTNSWLAPSCSETCMPRKPCTSWCETLVSECLPPHVVGMLGQISPGGPLRAVVESQVKDKKALEIVDIVLSWVENDCSSGPFNSDEDCQTEVTSPSCTPPAPETSVDHGASTTSTTIASSTTSATSATSPGSSSDTSALTGTQKMMGNIVEGAVDKAKGEIGGLMPQIEEEIENQEKSMAGKLSKAELALTGSSDKNLTPKLELTGTQKMMGTVVEGAVDKAKGEIGSLIPKIEIEIVKQEEEMEDKLNTAEKSLTNDMDVSKGQEDTSKETTGTNTDAPLTGTQIMMGNVVEGAVGKAKNEIGSLMPQIENEIIKQEDDMQKKLNTAEQALTNSSSASGLGDIYTQDAEKEAKEEKVDVRKFLPPSWQKDVVVDEDAGVAMRMLDDKVQPL